MLLLSCFNSYFQTHQIHSSKHRNLSTGADLLMVWQPLTHHGNFTLLNVYLFIHQTSLSILYPLIFHLNHCLLFQEFSGLSYALLFYIRLKYLPLSILMSFLQFNLCWHHLWLHSLVWSPTIFFAQLKMVMEYKSFFQVFFWWLHLNPMVCLWLQSKQLIFNHLSKLHQDES